MMEFIISLRAGWHRDSAYKTCQWKD